MRKQDWVIERAGPQYMTLYGWAPTARDALRFDTAEDAEIHMRRQGIRDAQATTVAPIDSQPVAGVTSDYNPFGTAV